MTPCSGYIDVATTYDAYTRADALVTVMEELPAGDKVQGVHLVAGCVATAANLAKMSGRLGTGLP